MNIAQHLAANELAAGLTRSEETNRAKGRIVAAYIDHVTRSMNPNMVQYLLDVWTGYMHAITTLYSDSVSVLLPSVRFEDI